MIVHFRFQLRTAENDRRKPSFLTHFEEFLKVVAFTQIAKNLHFWLILSLHKRLKMIVQI